MTVNFALRFGGTHDSECDCREAEAPLQGRLQGPALRGVADPAGGLVVSALSAQLPGHRGAVSGARPGSGPQHSEPLGSGLRAADRAPAFNRNLGRLQPNCDRLWFSIRLALSSVSALPSRKMTPASSTMQMAVSSSDTSKPTK